MEMFVIIHEAKRNQPTTKIILLDWISSENKQLRKSLLYSCILILGANSLPGIQLGISNSRHYDFSIATI